MNPRNNFSTVCSLLVFQTLSFQLPEFNLHTKGSHWRYISGGIIKTISAPTTKTILRLNLWESLASKIVFENHRSTIRTTCTIGLPWYVPVCPPECGESFITYMSRYRIYPLGSLYFRSHYWSLELW